MSKPERRSYISAVKCLRTKPSLLGTALYPAAKSLYDDFVIIHLQQTLNIHLTVSKKKTPNPTRFPAGE